MSSIKDGTWDSHDQHSTLSKGEWETVRRNMAEIPEPTRGTTDYTTEAPAPTVSLGAIPYWWRRAACHKEAPKNLDLFFSDKANEIKEAKAICARCPVAADCLLDSFTEAKCGYGTRAGMRPKEREIAKAQHERGVPIETILTPAKAGAPIALDAMYDMAVNDPPDKGYTSWRSVQHRLEKNRAYASRLQCQSLLAWMKLARPELVLTPVQKAAATDQELRDVAMRLNAERGPFRSQTALVKALRAAGYSAATERARELFQAINGTPPHSQAA